MNLGPGELAIILVIVLIVFGAGRLPQVFGSLGKGVKEFREASEGSDQKTTVTKTGPESDTITPAAIPGATLTTAHITTSTPNTLAGPTAATANTPTVSMMPPGTPPSQDQDK